eukprot:TRINITY_DN6460_c1_g3_i2.p1 TRINITY_DN6460_c1_g3~~TRINITY_DN6460_c1_g3_i2.p1  ORF type:complete len:566 (-),score=127.57 TRINITY_DN6460_c1_g3_i2:62-1759(-)
MIPRGSAFALTKILNQPDKNLCLFTKPLLVHSKCNALSSPNRRLYSTDKSYQSLQRMLAFSGTTALGPKYIHTPKPHERSFVDKLRLKLTAGNGGSGASSFYRAKKIVVGAADGGDGGKGGSVYLKTSLGIQNLYGIKTHYSAPNGKSGEKANRQGKDGVDVELLVPVGTVVKELYEPQPEEEDDYLADNWDLLDNTPNFNLKRCKVKQVIVDLEEPDTRYLVAKGGKGGAGNARFSTSTNRSPQKKELGEKGETILIELEMKTIADIGLVGFPNAGKSTLLGGVSNAIPKIRAYPFTTLHPYVGVVGNANEIELNDTFTVADLPGIIEGAHDNRGLGLDFLRHIERTKVLCFVIDMTDKNPWETYRTLLRELEYYQPGLSKRESLIVANKMDVEGTQQKFLQFQRLAQKHAPKVRIFSATAKFKRNLSPVISEMRKLLTRVRTREESLAVNILTPDEQQTPPTTVDKKARKTIDLDKEQEGEEIFMGDPRFVEIGNEESMNEEEGEEKQEKRRRRKEPTTGMKPKKKTKGERETPKRNKSRRVHKRIAKQGDEDSTEQASTQTS